MGISTIWDLLVPAEEKGVKISTLRGQTLAVDISTWITELKTAPNTQQFPSLYIRNLYFRLLEFLREGVRLVIVIDGQAPALKRAALQSRQQAQYGSSNGSFNPDRPMLAKAVQKCVEVFEGLGLPCIYAEGEGEATCAHLEANKLVDGCITEDSDYFCYGGQTLYRNLRKENRVYVVDKVSDVAGRAGLGRRDMVGLALLMGCDYSMKGVESVGKEKARELVKHLQARNLDVLDRLVGWRSNEELCSLTCQMSEKHEHQSHCSKCDHLGRVTAHRKAGCGVCRTETDCVASCERVCSCDWHIQKRLRDDHKLELNIRSKALKDPDFPDQKVIEEFLWPRGDNFVEFAQIKVPRLVRFLAREFRWGTSEILEKLVPCLILQQTLEPQLYTSKLFTPIRINKECTEKFVECYIVSWDKTETNNWADEQHSTSVEVKVEKALFESRYRALVRRYEEEKSAARAAKKPGKKRKTVTGRDSGQRMLTEFTKAKKKLTYPPEAGPGKHEPEPSSLPTYPLETASELSSKPSNMLADTEPALGKPEPAPEPSSSLNNIVLADTHSRLSKSAENCEPGSKIGKTLCKTSSSSSDTQPSSSSHSSGHTSFSFSKSNHISKQTADFILIETDEETDEETDTKTPPVHKNDKKHTQKVVTSKSTPGMFRNMDRNKPREANTVSKSSKKAEMCNQKSLTDFFKTTKQSKLCDTAVKPENRNLTDR